MDDDIYPMNIVATKIYACLNCNIQLEYPACPKCNPKSQEELPPLGVHVSETMGAKCKVGG